MQMPKIKIGKDSLKIVLVLVGIAVIAGLLLGGVKMLTTVDPDEMIKKEIEELYSAKVKKTLMTKDYTTENSEILYAFEMDDGAVAIQAHSNKSYDGGLNLIVVIKDGVIVLVNGEGNSETPGVGSKALTAEYLSGYVGIKTSEYAKGISGGTGSTSSSVAAPIKYDWSLVTDFSKEEKTEEGVAAVSGATKTSNGVKIAISAAVGFYNKEYAL